MSDPREKLIYWDNHQMPLSYFLTELGIDQDDIDFSKEAVYRNMRVVEPQA
jgi:hypothetical protein